MKNSNRKNKNLPCLFPLTEKNIQAMSHFISKLNAPTRINSNDVAKLIMGKYNKNVYHNESYNTIL
jgi:hypothetical protein